MDKINYSGKIFTYFEYAKEHDFEKDVIEHANEIFGPKSVYIDIKKSQPMGSNLYLSLKNHLL